MVLRCRIAIMRSLLLLLLYLAIVATATTISSRSGSFTDACAWGSFTSSASSTSETVEVEHIPSDGNHLLPEQCLTCTIRPRNLQILVIEVVTTYTAEIVVATVDGNGLTLDSSIKTVHRPTLPVQRPPGLGGGKDNTFVIPISNGPLYTTIL